MIQEKDLADGTVIATKLTPGAMWLSVFAVGTQNLTVFLSDETA